MSNQTLQASPVLIIGAGRSGTNMLRDVLARLEGIATWPCDEINYIWRHGNRRFPTDELAVAHATPEVVSYIRNQFDSLVKSPDFDSQTAGDRIILEKTCANSLRVPFVDSVLPEARYIHLIRDGRDAVFSALKRWKAPLDVPYLLAKARYVPKSDLHFYASQYFVNRVSKLFSKDSTLAVWGPKFEGMSDLATKATLAEVCAAQWVRCVELSSSAFEDMPANKVLHLRYEDFVARPVENLQSIVHFLSLDHTQSQLEQACSIVHKGSVGKGSTSNSHDLKAAESLMKDTLHFHGYTK